MTVELVLRTIVDAAPDVVFAASLDVDAHVASMSASGERAVGGVSSGQLGLGDTVTWRARHLGVVWRMTSRVDELDPGRRFVDEQVHGPFARFRHEHVFEADGGGTRMTDLVSFRAPLGPLGRLAEKLVLARYLEHLLRDRNAYLKALVEGRAPDVAG
jgi:ligand-binding SRPBCC domain-containing protein